MSKKSGDRVALHWAASEGDLAKANQLLKDGAPVDPQDEVCLQARLSCVDQSLYNIRLDGLHS